MLFPMMTFLTIAVVYEDHPLSLDMVLRLQKSTPPNSLDSMIQTLVKSYCIIECDLCSYVLFMHDSFHQYVALCIATS